jgi:hypothetical protein
MQSGTAPNIPLFFLEYKLSKLNNLHICAIFGKACEPSAERKEKLAFAGMCPYLKDAKDMRRTVCECAKFTFPDRAARREILYGYCGHPTAWKSCPLKISMDHYYDRRYESDEKGAV